MDVICKSSVSKEARGISSDCLLWVIIPGRIETLVHHSEHRPEYVCSLGGPAPSVYNTMHVFSLLKLKNISCNLLSPIGCLRLLGHCAPTLHPPGEISWLGARITMSCQIGRFATMGLDCIHNQLRSTNFCSLLG